MSPHSLPDWVVWLVALAASGAALTALARLLFSRTARSIPNFQGRQIPCGYGVYAAGWAVAGGIAAAAGGAVDGRTALVYLLIILIFAILGWIDDHAGSGESRGFAGHFRALLRGRVTTGALKAFVGGAACLGAAAVLPGHGGPPEVLLDGVVIALSANMVNLLDVRPGRAGWVFLIASAALLLAAPRTGFAAMALPVVTAEAVLIRRDSAGEWMMGDAGSNVLGGILGIGVVLKTGTAATAVVFLLLAALHAVSERWPLSGLIAKSRVLSALDRKLGVR